MEILLADDDPVSLHLMRRTLEQSGYQVTAVQNGRRAVEELSKRNAPRLALIDWMMPEVDGPSVCRAIRNRQGELYTYMLLLTAKESNADIVAGLEAGADDYLTKPCHPSELMARLHTGRRILSLEDRLVEARDEMRYRATHDALTGLWNRSGILNIVRQELNLVVKTDEPASLLLCDIDHFKQINDRYGHMIGDNVLRKVAERLGDAVRVGDSVGRYGGEEFLIVLHGCGREAVHERAEQVRSTVQNIPIMTDCGPLPVSISMGAIALDTWSAAQTIEQALSQADAALYRAKAAGRNRVMYAEQLVTV